MQNINDIDFMSETFMLDPFQAESLARKQQPVHKVGDLFYVFTYDLIEEVLQNPEVFSSRNDEMMLGRSVHDPECQAIIAKGWPQAETLLNNDPPSHARFRKLVGMAFSPVKVSKMEEHISRTVDTFIDRFIDNEYCEVVSELADPLPGTIIAEQMGMPASELDKIKLWTNAFIELIASVLPQEEEMKRSELVVEFQHYLKAKADERVDTPQDDMLSDLVNARVDDERPLDTAELLNIAQQIIVAGNTTTPHTITAGLYFLLQQPEQMQLVRENPALIPNMVEEVLRVLSPTYAMYRKAVKDTELGGVSILAGSQLMLRFGSGNRDEKYFPDGQSFNIQRKFTKPHMSFSKGIHTCIGANLARKEVICTFQQLLARTTNIRLAKDKPLPSYFPSLQLRGLDQLHIEFDKVR